MGKYLPIIACVLALAVASACTAPSTVPSGPGPAATTVAANTQSKWDNIVAEAKKEGKVEVYGTFGEVKEGVTRAFKERYGIEVEFVTGGGSEVSKKVLAERAAGLYLADTVILGAPTVLLTLKPQKVLIPLEPLIMTQENLDPRAWPDGKIPYLDSEHLSVALTGPYRTFTLINTDLVKDGDIKSYRDLADPRWKEKLVLFDPTITGSTNSWMAFMLKLYGLQEGEKYFQDIARQAPAILKDKRLHVEWVARGKYAIGPGSDATMGSEFFRAGAPVKWLNPSEGGLVHPGGTAFGIVDKAPHPNAAILFCNWILSNEGQTVFSQGYGNPALRLGVTGEGLDPFLFAPKGVKVMYYDEEMSKLEGKAMEMAKNVFGPLMK